MLYATRDFTQLNFVVTIWAAAHASCHHTPSFYHFIPTFTFRTALYWKVLMDLAA